MAGDDVIANPLDPDKFIPTVRFYCWDPSAVSLGVHQTKSAVDHKLCSARDWDVVRRPTGGRALLHDEDLSYSVSIEGGVETPDRLKVLYEAIANAWMDTFRKFHITAGLVRNRSYRTGSDSRLRDGLCLDSRVRGELVLEGRKIAAAAQRIYPKTILQHGSITLQGDVASIADVLPLQEEQREISRKKLQSSAGSMSYLTGRTISPEELIEAAIIPFEERLGVQLISGDWHDHELGQIENRLSQFEVSSVRRTIQRVVNG